MLKRPEVTPPIDAADLSAEALARHLRGWQSDTLSTVEAIQQSRERVEDSQKRMESPQAARQFAEFFVDFFVRCAADLEGVIDRLAAGHLEGQSDAVRRIAAAAAAEEQRCVGFRDKWLNRPLPYEDARPVLVALSTAARDQLIDYRQLPKAADRLHALSSPPPPRDPAASSEHPTLDRRELFDKLFRKPED
jgi:hypothetical protein